MIKRFSRRRGEKEADFCKRVNSYKPKGYHVVRKAWKNCEYELYSAEIYLVKNDD